MSDNEIRGILAPYDLDEKQVIGLISSIDAWHLRQSTEEYWRGHRQGLRDAAAVAQEKVA